MGGAIGTLDNGLRSFFGGIKESAEGLKPLGELSIINPDKAGPQTMPGDIQPTMPVVPGFGPTADGGSGGWTYSFPDRDSSSGFNPSWPKAGGGGGGGGGGGSSSPEAPVDVAEPVEESPGEVVVSVPPVVKRTAVTIVTTDLASSELTGMFVSVAYNNGTVAHQGFSPFVFNATENQIYLVTPQDFQTYTFDHWSHDGNKNRILVVLTPASPTTYTAQYNHTPPVVVDPPTPDPDPSPVVDPKVGVYVPLYAGLWNQAGRDTWQAVIDAKKAHPDVPFTVAYNPASGPGLTKNNDYVVWTKALKDAGVEHVIGYLGTNYCSELPKSIYPPGNAWPSDTPKTMAAMKNEIDRYYSFGYVVDGFMLDDFENDKTIVISGVTKDVFSCYQELTNYARSKGATWIKGNPGTQTHEDYLAMTDIMNISEGQTYRSLADLDKWTLSNKYDNSEFSITYYSIASLDTNYVRNSSGDIGWYSITDDGPDGNPYDELPTYFNTLLDTLDSINKTP